MIRLIYARLNIVFVLLTLVIPIKAQNIYINSSTNLGNVPQLYKPGFNYTPKTNLAAYDFITNGVYYNSIRIMSVEQALNWPTVNSINGVMAVLEASKPGIMLAKQHCDKLIIPILKIPAWLSSSNNTTPFPASVDPNWTILNGMPPANYNTWTILMDSIVNKINNQWGLNAYYEIWNEPENYYWQGTTAQYFTFFKNTFKAIKLNHPTALVGGPVVASFNSCFSFSLPKGHLTNSQYNQTIISNVIDSCVFWNIKLDFISWHKFDPLLQSVNEEILYLNQKLLTSGHGIVPYIVSEHNQTSSLRDTYFSNAFLTSHILKLEKMGVLAHSIASWQDFDPSNTEFHKDYGVLSWNSLQKPVWKSVQLLNRLKGNRLKNYCNDSLNLSVAASYNDDTIRTFISNYQLPAFAETKSYLYYLKNFNSTDFAVEGLASDNHLDSIFRGLIVLPSTSLLSQSINQATPYYNRADSMFKLGRTINLHFKGLMGIHYANLYMVDSINNNVIYKYDSLITNGYTRNSAVMFLYPNNTLSFKTITIKDSIYSFHLKSNSVALIEALMQNPLSIDQNKGLEFNFKIYPNPSNEKLIFELEKEQYFLHTFQIFNNLGICVKEGQLVNRSELDVSNLSEGLYIIQIKEYPSQKQKFIKVH